MWSKDPSFIPIWSKLPFNDVISVSQLNSLTWILIIAGIFSCFIGVIGCVGAKNKSRLLLSLYLVLIVALLLFELIGIFFGVSFQSRLKSDLDNILSGTIAESLGRTNQTDPTIHQIAVTTINQIQSAFSCCGSQGIQDYAKFNATLPASCYSNGEPFVSGCVQSIYNMFTSNLPIVMGCLVVIMIIELCAIMFSICLCAKHKQEAYDQF